MCKRWITRKMCILAKYYSSSSLDTLLGFQGLYNSNLYPLICVLFLQVAHALLLRNYCKKRTHSLLTLLLMNSQGHRTAEQNSKLSLVQSYCTGTGKEMHEDDVCRM